MPYEIIVDLTLWWKLIYVLYTDQQHVASENTVKLAICTGMANYSIKILLCKSLVYLAVN